MIPIPTKRLQNGFELPVLGLGTWQMGGTKERNPQNDDSGQIAAIQGAIHEGITHIDTAENYAEGWAEKLVGEAVKDLDRKKLIITTKVDKIHLQYEQALQSCKASLKRLQTDYIDLYLIHSPSPHDEVPLKETVRAFDTLKKEGMIRFMGVSNFTTKRLVEAQQLTEQKIVTNQVYYNVKMREPETEGLLWHCQTQDVLLTAYRPFEKGVLLTSIPPVIIRLAEKYHKTPVQVILNWLISQKNVVTIVKAATLEHTQENIGAVGWYMDPVDIEAIRTQYPNQEFSSASLPLR